MRLRTYGAWPTKQLAAQVLINCDYDSYGCSGGTPTSAYYYMKYTGIPDESCLPLTGTQERCEDVNICRSCEESGSCYPVRDYTTYKVADYGRLAGEKAMMAEIYQSGTISCRINVNRAFTNYQKGIFSQDGLSLYTHYITIVGWGEEDGEKYWIVRNTWGSYWGEQGYARVLRGSGVMGIESDCSWGEPLLSGLNSVNHTAASPASSRVSSMGSRVSSTASRVTSTGSRTAGKRARESFSSCGYPTDWTVIKPVIRSPLPASYVNVSALPASFDIRFLRGRNYATPEKNERSPLFCNACWAQATTSALSDRLNLRRKGAWPMFLASSQALLNCVGDGCGGGDPGDVYRHAYLNGIPDTTCQTYEGEQKACQPLGTCMDCGRDGDCWGVSEYRRLFVSEYGEVSGVDAMKAEIHERGPITCFMVMTKEFMEYESGVFVEHDHHYKGGHIVEVTGWGVTEAGQPYWIVRNNWGENWGENGWVRVNMGGSNLMIETSCSWGVPFV